MDFWCTQRRPGRAEGLKESFVKIKAVYKVLDRIVLGFTQQAMVHKVEYNVSDIETFVNAPFQKYALG